MNSIFKQLTIVALVFLVGCAGRKQDMEISKNVFDKPSSIVITQIEGLEKADIFHSGEQGLLAALINDASASPILEYLQKIDATEIIEEHYFKPFETAFRSKSFTVQRSSEKLKRESLTKYEGDTTKYAEFDFRFLKDKYNAEFALILDPSGYGILKDGALLSSRPPKGYAYLTIYLVRLTDNLVLGHYNAATNIDINGEWDKPPYSMLTKAAKTALKSALNNAYWHFFDK